MRMMSAICPPCKNGRSRHLEATADASILPSTRTDSSESLKPAITKQVSSFYIFYEEGFNGIEKSVDFLFWANLRN